MFVTFDDVCKTYDGETNVVDHLDLTIAEGEFLSLLGPSGSGKTTTLLMLAGFERPTAGRIRLRGQPIVWNKNNHFRTQQSYRVYHWNGTKIESIGDWRRYDVM